MRVYLLCMVCLESIFWLRRHHPFQCPLVPRVGGEILEFRSLRSRDLATFDCQNYLRSSFAASAFRDAFLVYYSRIVFGYFSPKSTFIKISLPLHLPNPPRGKDQGRTKDEPRNTQRTPYHQKVLFIKIGYLKEIFVTVASAICLPCQMPLSISFTPLCKVSLHSRTSAKMSHR